MAPGSDPTESEAGNEPHEEPRLRYGLLGEDESTTEEKLRKYRGRAGWEDLKKPFAAGTLIYVDPSLDLTEVGRAFAEDARDRVAAWLKRGDLVRPTEPHAAYWEASKEEFQCQVVSPFVLIQPVQAKS